MATGTARWRDAIRRVSNETDVPASLIEAVMRLESNGNPDALSPSGAVGLMQVMPEFWSHLGNLHEPESNILVGAKILAHLQRQHGPKGHHGWDRAICAYFTGRPEPSGAMDPFSSDFQYIERVNRNWDDIDRETQGDHTLLGPPASASVINNTATLLAAPDPDADVIVTLKAGNVVQLIGPGTGDYLPVTHQDSKGWIHGANLSARTAESLTLQSTPDLLDDGSNVVGTLEPGTMVRLKGKARTGFVGIERDGATAWIYGQYLDPPLADGSLPTAGATATVRERARLRHTPSFRSTENVVSVLDAGSAVTLTGNVSVGFVSIARGDTTAWAFAEYLCAGADAPKPDGDSNVEGTQVTVVDSGVRLRSAPEIDPGNILVDGVPVRSTLTLTGETANNFVAVDLEGQTGWMAAEFLCVRVNDRGVRLRSAPNVEDPGNILVEGMHFGETLTLTGQASHGFLAVKTPDGTTGWAAARYLGPLPLVPGLSAIWGGVAATITQSYLNRTGPDLYRYGLNLGLDGRQHPGIDVGLPYGTTLFAPMAGTITCAGTGDGDGADGMGCGAFGDTGDCCPVNGRTCSHAGAGRVEMELDNGAMLILGHSRKSFFRPGARVEAGEAIATVGGMCGAHTHVEVRVRDPNVRGAWKAANPEDVLGPIAQQI